VLTRPVAPAVLRLIGHIVSTESMSAPGTANPGELIIPAQLIELTARRVELEPGFIAEEVQDYLQVGELVLSEQLGDTSAMAAAMTDLRAHLAGGQVQAHDTRAYALASEVLCLAIDATAATTGPARTATEAALALRQSNQATIVGDFSIAGR